MTIKIYLDTAALQAVVASDPKIELEIKSLACEQVAEIMRRKIAPQAIRDAIDAALKEAISTKWGYNGARQLTDETRRMIKEELPHLIPKKIYEEQQATIDKMIKEKINSTVEWAKSRIEADLGGRIDRMILSRIESLMKGLK